jgi:hypothetical protein
LSKGRRPPWGKDDHSIFNKTARFYFVFLGGAVASVVWPLPPGCHWEISGKPSPERAAQERWRAPDAPEFAHSRLLEKVVGSSQEDEPCGDHGI